MIAVGSVVAGRFRLERPLGHGGMGEVWVAFDERLAARCAVKFLQPTSEPEAEARFLREAQAAAQLRSPYVIAMLDHGTSEGRAYIAMELLDGEDLSKRLRRVGALDALETVRIVTHVGRALSRAHGLGLVHRDLKPANIVVVRDEDGPIAKVLDFGIAKVDASLRAESARLDAAHSADVSLEQTIQGQTLGTPTHMSPEHVNGLAVDHRSDLWALGVIAYECVTGLLPFRARSLGQLVSEITTEPVVPASSIVPSTPAAVDAWFDRALAKDREARFADAKQMTDALANAFGLGHQPGAGSSMAPPRGLEPTPPESLPFARTEVVRTRAQKTGPLRRVFWILGAAILASVALGILVSRSRGARLSRAPFALTGPLPTLKSSAVAPGFSDPSAIVQLAGTTVNSCALFASGRAACWGTNSMFGSLAGARPNQLALEIPAAGKVREIRAHTLTLCRLLESNAAECSGGDPALHALIKASYVDQIDLSVDSACVLGRGELTCLRPNGTGGLESQRLSSSASRVAIGSDFGCWLEENGEARCWRAPSGMATREQLRAGLRPKRVPELDSTSQLAAGRLHACGIRKDRRVVCAGSPSFDALGMKDPRKFVELSPGLTTIVDSGQIVTNVVPQLERVIELVVGDRFSCARTEDRNLMCWGANELGQLGRGSTTASEPTPALAVADVVVAGAGNDHACAVRANRELVCWGRGMEMQLGRASLQPCGRDECQPTPSLANPW